MTKKFKNKNQIPGHAAGDVKISEAKAGQNNNNKIIALIFCFGFILYANTLFNDFALDDKLAITDNEFTKSGFAGIPDILKTDYFTGFYGKKTGYVTGGRYRPLSLVTFAIGC